MRFPQYATERLVTAAALLTALTLAGCSSASQMPTGGGTSGQSAGTAPSSGPVVPMPATTELRGSAGVPSAKVGAAADSFAAAPSPASAPIPPGFPAPPPRSSNAMEKPAAQPGAAAAGGNPAAPQQPAPAANFDRMIIYTTTIALTVKDVPAAVDEVSGLTARSGGYLSGSSVRQEGERTIATITLRVPAQGYADVMTALRRMSVKVESEKGEAKDVTEEFADIDAQVRNLEVTEAQLQELMKKATTIDEILRVQNQISTVRGQIERLKGRAQYLQRNADLATITVTLAPELPAKVTVETPVGWDPLRVAAGAWRESLRAVQAVLTVGIVTVVFFWWLLPPLALFGFWMMSRRNGRRAAPAANAAP